jgi:hypothetical protein
MSGSSTAAIHADTADLVADVLAAADAIAESTTT